jgi:hypothetical protein
MACAQAAYVAEGGAHPGATSVCQQPATPPALREALSLVCLRGRQFPVLVVRKAIVVGFVGGFVKPDDTNHPEVLFARYLRGRYGPAVQVEVFGNHDEKRAVYNTLQLLSTSAVGSMAVAEDQPTKIIVYGHSWGASQGLTFARDLARHGVPVQLTIQIDSVKKFGHDDRTIPPNVAKAVNFYQTRGLTPGQSHIVATEGAPTKILGNFHMIYRDHRINCDNYKWLSRMLNKAHHEIENDPQVWDQIAVLIDSELAESDSSRQAVYPIDPKHCLRALSPGALPGNSFTPR